MTNFTHIKRLTKILLPICLLAVSTSPRADDALVPLPSIFDFTDGVDWGIALGAAVEYGTAYDGADEYELELEPVMAVQYRQGDNLFFWQGIEIGWRGLLSRKFLMQAGVRYEGGLEPDDSTEGQLDGIAARDSHVVGFLEGRWSVGHNWRNWVGGRLMGGASDFGWLGVIAAGHRFGDQTDGTGTEILIFSTFGNSQFINKDFGITAEDAANSSLPQTELSGGYRSTGLSLIHRVDLTEQIQLIGQAGIELYSKDIQSSPIARQDYETEIGLSAVYIF